MHVLKSRLNVLADTVGIYSDKIYGSFIYTGLAAYCLSAYHFLNSCKLVIQQSLLGCARGLSIHRA